MTLRYQFSNRKDFTYTAPRHFTWTSSDETVAQLSVNEETGLAEVLFTRKTGMVVFTLTIDNGSEETAYTLETPVLVTLEGKTPFLTIPPMSQVRTTLTGEATDVSFTSNLTARNAAAA